MHKLFFFLVLVFVCADSFSRPREKNEALRIATKMLGEANVLKEVDDSMLARGRKVQSNMSFYIFNAENNAGFVIVGGDDRLPEVMAYSHSGTFDVSNLHPAAEAFLDAIIDVAASGIESSKEIATRAAENPVPIVEPLIQTQWNQGAPYNGMCPMDGLKHSLVGCVATAFSQILRYWEWPKIGNGKLSYTCSLPGYGKIEVDFSQSEYDWESMPNTTKEINDSPVSKDAVAKLCYECGVATRMNYSHDGSGTQDSYSVQALYSYMRYRASTISWLFRECFSSQEEWDAIWKKELDEGRPLLYAGTTVDLAGHAFIFDGYDSNGYVHVNWGWGGNSDGYYNMSYLGTVGSIYSEQQTMIVGIEPDYDDSDVVPKQWRTYIEDVPKLKLPSSGLKLGNSRTFQIPTFYSMCPFYVTWELGVGLYDLNGTFIQNIKVPDVINGDEVMLSPYKGDTKVTNISFPNELEDGMYSVRIVFRQSGYDDWELPYMVGGSELNNCFVSVREGKVYLCSEDEINSIISADAAGTEYVQYFDLQGRKLLSPAKGKIAIKREMLSDGSSKTYKVFVK